MESLDTLSHKKISISWDSFIHLTALAILHHFFSPFTEEVGNGSESSSSDDSDGSSSSSGDGSDTDSSSSESTTETVYIVNEAVIGTIGKKKTKIKFKKGVKLQLRQKLSDGYLLVDCEDQGEKDISIREDHLKNERIVKLSSNAQDEAALKPDKMGKTFSWAPVIEEELGPKSTSKKKPGFGSLEAALQDAQKKQINKKSSSKPEDPSSEVEDIVTKDLFGPAPENESEEIERPQIDITEYCQSLNYSAEEIENIRKAHISLNSIQILEGDDKLPDDIGHALGKLLQRKFNNSIKGLQNPAFHGDDTEKRKTEKPIFSGPKDFIAHVFRKRPDTNDYVCAVQTEENKLDYCDCSDPGSEPPDYVVKQMIFAFDLKMYGNCFICRSHMCQPANSKTENESVVMALLNIYMFKKKVEPSRTKIQEKKRGLRDLTKRMLTKNEWESPRRKTLPQSRGATQEHTMKPKVKKRKKWNMFKN